MTDQGVNEPNPPADSASTRPPRYRRHLRRILVALLSAGVVLLIAQFLILPTLLRARIEIALRDAGVVGAIRFRVSRATLWGAEMSDITAADGSSGRIDHITLDYSLDDLRQGRLKAIRIAGADIRLGLRDGKIDLTPLTSLVRRTAVTTATAPTTSPSALPALPVGMIELADSKVTLVTDKDAIAVPVGGSVIQQADGRLSVSAQLGQEKSLVVGGEIVKTHATFAGSADAGRTLLIVRSIWPDAQVGVDGKLKLSGAANWDTGNLQGDAQIEIVPDEAATELSKVPTKLHLLAGVFHVAARFGTSEPPVRLSMMNASLAMEEQGVNAEAISGEIAFASLAPLATLPSQRIRMAKLKVGSTELAGGDVEFRMINSNQLLIQNTAWTWLGGRVSANDVAIAADQPIRITLHAQDIELKDLLALLAKDKATGEGKLSGDLPITINGSDVQFGNGTVTAMRGGVVQIKDMAAILPTAEAAAKAVNSASASDQVKRNIIEALSNFQFDHLSAELKTEKTGLAAFVSMKGHGRTGAKQKLDYDLNVHGLDKLLRSYGTMQSTMAIPTAAASAAVTPAPETPVPATTNPATIAPATTGKASP